MTRKVVILLVLTLAAAFMGFALLHAADNKVRAKAENNAAAPATVLAPRLGLNKPGMVETEVGIGTGTTGTGFVSRYTPTLATAASPYVLIHTGAREFDQNGTWKRHVVNLPGGNIHVTFGLFDSIASPLRNNNYAYNCYNPTTGALTFPIGSEPTPPAAALGQTLQNGAIDVTPSGRAVIVGRSILGAGGNKGTGFEADAGGCLGVFSADTAFLTPTSFVGLDPDFYIINETTWVVSISSFGTHIGLQQWATRTTNGGVSWSAGTPLIQSSFLSSIFAGRRDGDGNPNNDVVWCAATGCNVDSGCPSGEEEILVTRSTDGGQTWMIPAISASGAYEYPAYGIGFARQLASMMVGDTFHVAWICYSNDGTAVPGQHIHQLAVAPNLSVNGPRKVADCNFAFAAGAQRTLSNATGGAAAFGGGYGIAHNPTMAYNPTTKYYYILWSQPPTGPNGSFADSSIGAGGHIYPNSDIFMAASRNNGRSFDAATNETMTDHPGCTGYLGTPCEIEDNIGAAVRADSFVWTLAQVQKTPGWGSVTAADQGQFAGVTATNFNQALKSDEWRLYKIAARVPVVVASCGAGATPIPQNVHAIPGGPNVSFTYNLNNTGLADIVLDSVKTTGTLNDGDLITNVSAAVPGTSILELGSYSFTVIFNPSGVSPSEAGLRSGNIVSWVHTNDPLATNFNQALSCLLPASVYVVPELCFFSNDSIHSGSNASRLGTSGCAGCATPGASGFNDGMFYASTNDGYIFEAAPAFVNPNQDNITDPIGVRWYFADQFLRCLRAYSVDSTAYAGGYNIHAKNVVTGLLDSSFVAEVVWEQSTDPAYSDFLALTVKVGNVTGAALNGLILGASCDADVPTGFNGVNTPAIRFGPHNLSYDVNHVSAVDGKTYHLAVLQGIDTLPGEFGDPTIPDPNGRLCTGNSRFFGILTLPNGAASSSPVQARGDVTHSNRILSTGGWADSTFVRNMRATGYHSGKSGFGDPFTGMDTFFILDSCNAANGFPNGISTDVGHTTAAESIGLGPNPQFAAIVGRYGMEGLAASLDTASNVGADLESYQVIFVAGIADSLLFIESVDSAISWNNQNAGQQIGGDLAAWHRGDLDDNGIINGTDVVRCSNAAFLNSWVNIPSRGNIPPSLCTADVSMDGVATGTDVVRLTNYAFLGTLPTAGYPALPLLMGCF